MIKIVNIVFVLSCFITIMCCCSNNKQHEGANMINERIAEKKHGGKDSVIVVNYGQLRLFWDLNNSCFIPNKSLDMIENHQINPMMIDDVIYSINDTTDLHYSICSKASSLKKGDIAFILLYESKYVFPARDLGVQFDYFENDCIFPIYLLDYVEDNRELVVKKLLANKKLI